MAQIKSKTQFSSLPNEILLDIVSRIAAEGDDWTLTNLRSVNRALERTANQFIFQHMQLGVCERTYAKKSQTFLKVAQSKKLRENVKEVTINTNFYSYLNRLKSSPDDDNFIDILPYMKYFKNTKVLTIYIHNHCGEEEDQVQKLSFSHWVLYTIFHCLAGTYTTKIRNEMDNPIRPFLKTIPFSPRKAKTETIQIEKLFIHTWDDKAVLNIADSTPFRAVCSNPHFRVLELNVLTSIETNSMNQSDEYIQPARLLLTWLRPPLAQHLNDLALRWSHQPQDDCLTRLRTQACCPGMPSPGMPNLISLPCLKKLTLHNYIFCFDWQAAWVCSLGRGGYSQGLEELELINCSIASRRLQMGSAAPELAPLSPDSLEWHDIFESWAQHMLALKIFSFSTSDWPPPLAATVELVAHNKFNRTGRPWLRIPSEDGALQPTHGVDAAMVEEEEDAPAKELVLSLTKTLVYSDLLDDVDKGLLLAFPPESITLQDSILKRRQKRLTKLDQEAFALLKSKTKSNKGSTNPR